MVSILLDLIEASTDSNLLRTIKSEAGSYSMDGAIIFVRLAQYIFTNRHNFDTALLTNLRLKVSEPALTEADPLAAIYLSNIRNFLILYDFTQSGKKLKDQEVYKTFFQTMKEHLDVSTNLYISRLYRTFTTNHTKVDALSQIIHKLTLDSCNLRAQGTALTAASKKRTSTAGIASLHSEGEPQMMTLYATKFTTV